MMNYYGSGYGMMGWGGNSLNIFGLLLGLVVLVDLVLVGVWLWKNIQK